MAEGSKRSGRGTVPCSWGEAVEDQEFHTYGTRMQGPWTRDLMTFYTIKGSQPAANTYYRIEVPFRVVAKLGIGKLSLEDHGLVMGPDDLKHILIRMGKAHVHLYYGAPGRVMHERVHTVLGINDGREEPFNRIRKRPSIIWTLDDNYHYVHPLNQAFLWNGYRDAQGRPMGRGDSCEITMPDGQVVTLWKYGAGHGPDGTVIFRPEENRKKITQMDTLLRAVDGVTFTTKRLEAWYRKHSRLKNTYVYPNSILFPDYDWLREYRMVRKDPSIVKVLWQGGASHFGDLLAIAPAIKRLTKRFPKVRWIFWGAKFDWVHRLVPDDQYEYIPWANYDAYRPMLATLDFDFALAPLVANQFNDGKSCIKFYEPAALPNPRPTLVARVPPYSDEMIDGEIGLSYDPNYLTEFEEKFGQLVESAELRNRLAANCHDWLRENRDAMKTTPSYIEWIHDSRGRGYSLAPEVCDLVDHVVGRNPGCFARARHVHNLAHGVG